MALFAVAKNEVTGGERWDLTEQDDGSTLVALRAWTRREGLDRVAREAARRPRRAEPFAPEAARLRPVRGRAPGRRLARQAGGLARQPRVAVVLVGREPPLSELDDRGGDIALHAAVVAWTRSVPIASSQPSPMSRMSGYVALKRSNASAVSARNRRIPSAPTNAPSVCARSGSNMVFSPTISRRVSTSSRFIASFPRRNSSMCSGEFTAVHSRRVGAWPGRTRTRTAGAGSRHGRSWCSPRWRSCLPCSPDTSAGWRSTPISSRTGPPWRLRTTASAPSSPSGSPTTSCLRNRAI